MDEDERQDLASEYFRYKHNEGKPKIKGKTKMTTKTEPKKSTRYLSPIGRVSYCNVWKPRDEKDLYDITLILDQPKDMSEKDKVRWNKLKELLLETKRERFPKVKSPIGCPIRTVKGYKTDDFFSKPLDGEKNPEFIDKIIIRATSYGRQPEIIGPDKEEIINKGDFYSGCYAILSLTAFAYDTDGNKGISFGVQHIMKVKDGTPFVGSAVKAATAFEEIEADDFSVVDTDEGDSEEFDI
jgi:Protein of unknown function (DUF2815)